LPPISPAPLRGILALGAPTPKELKERLDEALHRVEGGWTPAVAAPEAADLSAPERLVIDFGDHDELLDRLQKAQKVMGFDSRQAWVAIQSQGIFRGSGPRPGKVAFLFPGQGSQYVNMGRALARVSPVVAGVIAEADRIMTPILGRPLTAYVFVDSDEPAGIQAAEWALMQTEITQPAMLTLDTAIFKLLAEYGFKPDMVMGHSLGEYAALIAAGIMDFADSLEAAAARGDEMRKIQVNDNGKMAAVLAPYEVVEATLQEIDGYVVPANVNSQSQCVIGGDSEAVEKAAALFQERGYRAMLLPVSHAFHTRIVAPASGPLRQVLDRLGVHPSQLPLVGNLTGEFYPTSVEAIKGILQQQIASPVQWVKGLETLYAAGARCFVEVGPKKALKGFVDDVLGGKPDVISLFTNHPKTGELASFNHALCGLYAAGYGGMEGTEGTKGTVRSVETIIEVRKEEMSAVKNGAAVAPQGAPGSLDAVAQLLAQALQQATIANSQLPIPNYQSYDLTRPPAGSVVISGTGLGLPGADKAVMDADNAHRILRGEQFVDLIPERFRRKMLEKRITRLVKSEDGSGRFETIDSPDEVIRLAGRPGSFDLAEEYGVPDKLVEALDVTSQLAMAAGLDALREAGLPLVQTYRRTNNGKYLPDRWLLPEALRDETGVIFASAFPGGDRFVEAFEAYFEWQNRVDQLAMLEELRQYTADPDTLREIGRRIGDLRETLERKPYVFDRRFIFRILAMGHSQFAEYVGARGPNTQVNAACSSTTQALSIAEDWIRAGRCRRVLVIAADDVTGEHLMEWVGAGFLALGAAATDDRVDEAALPFDRRRHGTLLGMGACTLVVESEDAVRERGMRGIVELLSSETRNSAFHGSRLDVDHIAQVMDALVTTAERRFGLHRQAIAPQTVFMSHETYTPARGGSASAEVVALRQTFGEAASEIVVANTKGFTGHPMGVGVEDVIAVKILEHATVPPVPNFKEVDPELGRLNLSRGGRYPVQYALHLAAGFGSQIAMTLTRRIAGSPSRLDNRPQYQRWLDDVTGYDQAETEVVKRVLRVKAQGAPKRTPAPCVWQYGTGPMMRTPAAGDGFVTLDRPLPLPATNGHRIPPAVAPAPEPVTPVRMENEGQRPANGRPPIAYAQPALRAASEDAPSSALLRSQASSDAGLKETTILVSTPPSVSRSSADDVNGRVLQIVADQTGYPLEMLDLDLDLEADLGIDTVKQAETFLAIREAFDIPRRDNLRLRDYPTLGHVVNFVRESRPELVKDGGRKTEDDRGPAADGQPPSSVIRPSSDEIAGRVLQIVADQTGYPLEMLDLDLDLEADLGIDTVKQAETFLAIREAFDISRRDDLKLRDYPTLARVIDFVREGRPELAADRRPPPTDGQPAARAASGDTPSSIQSSPDDVAGRVLQIVAEQTGYPEEMLDLDLDLEADLGIDTVKQAETFLAIREAFDIPRRDDLKLRDYPTLGRVIEFVRESRPELATDGGRKTKDEPLPFALRLSSLEAADRFPRPVPTPSLRPSLDLCRRTGVTLDEKSRVVVMLDEGGVGPALVEQLGRRGVTTLSLTPTMTAEALAAQLKEWLAVGPVQGVYWLPALDVEPKLEELDLATWRELNRRRVKNLYLTMRTLYDSVREPGTFLVAATRLGGLHGYGPRAAVAPLGGAVVGFSKAYKREQEKALVKAVDFAVGADPAGLLIQETLYDPGVAEVGYWQGGRYTITLTEQPIPSSPHPGDFQNGVFVVTGAAGGITSAIVADLAAASGGAFYLLDLVAEPDPYSQKIALFRRDKEALKQHLIAEAKAAGERPTPAQIEKQLFALEREEAALRAIEAVQAAGGAAHYRSLNLLDGPAVTRVVDEIRARHGRIDVLVHAAGLEISRLLPDKDPAQFDLVFDVKADGFFNLLRAAKGMPIGATVAFSSVAGRFGNGGQTDYSAANDLLCKITSGLPQWRPETRGIVIDWTAWGGIGMATRGSIPKMMEMAGIEMLPPEVGIPTV
ncbi:MAG: SDR family NAD(P)-dependent oxidoreductase, partial [Chloroflexota bacterium]